MVLLCVICQILFRFMILLLNEILEITSSVLHTEKENTPLILVQRELQNNGRKNIILFYSLKVKIYFFFLVGAKNMKMCF